MPIGVIVNVLSVTLGGAAGAVLGGRMREEIKTKMNLVFGCCSLTIGISAIMNMENMPAVIFSVLIGTLIGLLIHLGVLINRGGALLQKGISAVIPARKGSLGEEAFQSMLLTVIVLFCASGTGIYGTIVSGMTGDHSILIAKSVLDFFTALIFACSLGPVVSAIALPQLVLFLLLFFASGLILPLTTPAMINDFKAAGGVILLATGLRIMHLGDFPVADMIPAMVVVMPVSHLWVTYILPLIS